LVTDKILLDDEDPLRGGNDEEQEKS